MQDNIKRLIDNFLSMTALQVVQYILPLITLPYLVRVIGVANYGINAFAAAFIAYFGILTDYGFGICSTKDIATNRHNKNNISHIFNLVIASKFILLLVSAIILLLAIVFVPKIHEYWLVFVLSFTNIIGFVLFPAWFFVGMERAKYSAILNIIARLFFLVAVFIFVKKADDYILIPLLTSLGSLIAGIIGYVYAVKEFDLKIYIPDIKSIFKQLKYATPFFFSNLSLVAYTNTNTFVLGLIGSNTMVGFYAAAYNIYNAILNIRYPISASLYPYMARYKDVKLYKKIILSALVITFVSSAFLFIFSKYVIGIFYGWAMLPAHVVFRIFCVALFFEMMHSFFGYQLLGVFGHMKTVNNIIMGGAIFHIFMLGVLYICNALTIYSVALLVTFTTLLLLSLKLFYTLKYKLLSQKAIS